MRGDLQAFRVPQLLNVLLGSDGVLEMPDALGVGATLSCTRGALRALSVGKTEWYDPAAVQACLAHLVMLERGRFVLHLDPARATSATNVRPAMRLELPLPGLIVAAYGRVDALGSGEPTDDRRGWRFDDHGLEIGVVDPVLRVFLSVSAQALKLGTSAVDLSHTLGLEVAWVRALLARALELRAVQRVPEVNTPRSARARPLEA
jgi:hypothetical protein